MHKGFIYLKTGSSDPADFATTRFQFPRLCHIAQLATANCQSRGKWTTDSCGRSSKKKKMTSVGSSHNGCATIGTLQPSQREMPSDKS
jgi:hypothetical protein